MPTKPFPAPSPPSQPTLALGTFSPVRQQVMAPSAPMPMQSIAPSEPARFLPATPDVVPADLFLLAEGIDCAAWELSSVASRRATIARHYHLAETDPLVTSILNKYTGDCVRRPGRALPALGISCATWRAMANVDRVLRLVVFASPDRTPNMDAFAAYADEITAYCVGEIRPGGQAGYPGDVPSSAVPVRSLDAGYEYLDRTYGYGTHSTRAEVDVNGRRLNRLDVQLLDGTRRVVWFYVTSDAEAIRASGQASPSLQEPLSNPVRFWQGTTVVATGIAIALWWRSRRK